MQPTGNSCCEDMKTECSDDNSVYQRKSNSHGSESNVDFVIKNNIDIMARMSDMNIKNGETQEKAMSLSALESNSSSHQGLNMPGKRNKNNQV